MKRRQGAQTLELGAVVWLWPCRPCPWGDCATEMRVVGQWLKPVLWDVAKAWTMASADLARRQSTYGQVGSSKSALVHKWVWYKLLQKSSPIYASKMISTGKASLPMSGLDLWRQHKAPGGSLWS